MEIHAKGQSPVGQTAEFKRWKITRKGISELEERQVASTVMTNVDTVVSPTCFIVEWKVCFISVLAHRGRKLTALSSDEFFGQRAMKGRAGDEKIINHMQVSSGLSVAMR